MPKPSPQLASALRLFAINQRTLQLLLDHFAHLDPALWTAKPPANTRPIAALFAHIHNIRLKWLRLSASHIPRPPQLTRTQYTPQQLTTALTQSAAALTQMLTEALGPTPSVHKFLRDGWAQPWPAGPEMLAYILTHEAHHRGQICMIAHQLGHKLPPSLTSTLWNWERLWKAGDAPDADSKPYNSCVEPALSLRPPKQPKGKKQ